MENCLSLLTFLPMDEVNRLSALQDSEINEAKKVLAFEVTKQVHGEEEAKIAQTSAESLFAGGNDLSNIPSCELTQAMIEESGLRIPDLLVFSKLASSKSDARRLIEGGGVFVGDDKVAAPSATLTMAQIEGEGVILRKGKKSYCRIRKA